MHKDKENSAPKSLRYWIYVILITYVDFNQNGSGTQCVQSNISSVLKTIGVVYRVPLVKLTNPTNRHVLFHFGKVITKLHLHPRKTLVF